MRILTHNSLRSHLKEGSPDEPFELEIEEMEVIETEMNPDFIKHILPTLDWKGIILAANAIGIEGMPEVYIPSLIEDEDFLQALHYLLLDVHIMTGYLICSQSKRKFLIENGIPHLM